MGSTLAYKRGRDGREKEGDSEELPGGKHASEQKVERGEREKEKESERQRALRRAWVRSSLICSRFCEECFLLYVWASFLFRPHVLMPPLSRSSAFCLFFAS